MTTKSSPGSLCPSIAVVERIATLEGTDSTELPPLYDVVDPDALDTLVDSVSESSNLEIEFQYYGYDITVTTSGEINVEKDTADEIIA